MTLRFVAALAGAAIGICVLANQARAQGVTETLTKEQADNIPTADLFRLARAAQDDRRCSDFQVIMNELYSRSFVTSREPDGGIDFLTAIFTFGRSGIPEDIRSTKHAPDQVFGPRGGEEYRALRREGCRPLAQAGGRVRSAITGGNSSGVRRPQVRRQPATKRPSAGQRIQRNRYPNEDSSVLGGE